MLLLWQMVDDRPFHKWNYLLAYVGFGCVAILVILIDSVLFSLLPVNFLMILLCMWIGFRRRFKEIFLRTLFQYLGLLYLQCIANAIVPASLFLTVTGNFIVNGCVLTAAFIITLFAKHFRLSKKFNENAGTVWTVVLVLCVPQIVLTQMFMAQRESPSNLVMTILLLLQILYVTLVLLGFSTIKQRNERRKLADTEKYIREMNEHLNDTRRSIHDFNKHIRYLHNAVMVSSADKDLMQRINEYCTPLMETYEDQEILLHLDDPVLRAVLYGRRTEATLKGVDLILDATPVLPAFPLKSYQFVEVFDNLLNNAFECVEKMDSTPRWIRITLSTASLENGYTRHTLLVENPSPQPDMGAIVGTKPYTSKGGNHQGVGLQHSVKVVHQTGGLLSISYLNRVFRARVQYDLPQNS